MNVNHVSSIRTPRYNTLLTHLFTHRSHIYLRGKEIGRPAARMCQIVCDVQAQVAAGPPALNATSVPFHWVSWATWASGLTLPSVSFLVYRLSGRMVSAYHMESREWSDLIHPQRSLWALYVFDIIINLCFSITEHIYLGILSEFTVIH